MRLSAIKEKWNSWQERRSQQELEVKENSNHPKKIWKRWEHTGWGDSIGWMNVEKGRMTGHTTPLPNKGDEIHCEMMSGKTGRFSFTEVEYCFDPSDMWFGTVEFLGYVQTDEKLLSSNDSPTPPTSECSPIPQKQEEKI